MRISDYVKRLNKTKVPVSKERWVDLKQYYISMYHFYLLKLYDMGYISDPTDLNVKDVRRVLVDFGISDFNDKSGSVIMDSRYALFSYYKHTDNEVKEFLWVLYLVLKYSEYCRELDKQYEMNKDYFKMNLGIKLGSKITSMVDIKYSKGVFTALVPDGYCLKEETIRKELFDLAMGVLGISKDGYCDGMFVSGMKLEDEIQFADLILDGGVKLDGRYSDKLESWLSENKWSVNSFYDVSGKGLYSYVFCEKSREVLDLFDTKTAEYGESLVAVYGDTFYLKKKMECYNIPVSFFVSITYFGREDRLLEGYNALYGYSGEAYSIAYLDSIGVKYVGIPVVVNIAGAEADAYDIDQVILSHKPDSWFKTYRVSFEFEDDFDCESYFPHGSLEYSLMEAYKVGMRGNVYKLKAPDGGIEAIKKVRKKVSMGIAMVCNHK